MKLEENRDGVCIRTLVANISGCSDWIRAVSNLFDSPCLGLYRRKEISSIGSLDVEIFVIKDRVRFFPSSTLVPFLQNGYSRPDCPGSVLVVLVPS